MRRLPVLPTIAFSFITLQPALAQQADPAQINLPAQQPAYGQQQTGTPARPAYNPDQQSTPPAMPQPQNVPPPVVAPRPTEKHPFTARNQYGPLATLRKIDFLGSVYIPVDSWIYPAMLRLYSFGYLDSAFISLRPWTRRSAINMLVDSEQDIRASDNEEARAILDSLLHEFDPELSANTNGIGAVNGLYSAYTRVGYINGPVLRDSYHLGQTISNDYARPYQSGFNNVTGFSTVTEVGRFSLNIRGEYQHAPSGEGYSRALSAFFSDRDLVNTPYAGYNARQATIPEGPIAATNTFRIQEANLSVHLLKHEFSLGKSDVWNGPGVGGNFSWSNNAENIYSFRINRVEPMYIPFVRRILGPLRYDFFVGSLKGHTYPNSPWVHSTAFSFSPTKNFQFGLTRTAIWGGKDHTPVTLHTFFKSFFHFQDTNNEEKYSRSDPGARFSTFTASWRPPLPKHVATLYVDAMVHDDVTPISAPNRSAIRSGLYLAQLPYLPKLDLRLEGAYTDPPVINSTGGYFMYYEIVQRQGYTNKGFIMGDPLGREAKGGNAWLTWHFSGNEWLQLSYMNKKNTKDFIPGGTTQNQFAVNLVKRLSREVELNATLQHERWKAPIYKQGQQSNTLVQFQLTWYPRLKQGLGVR